LTDPADTGFVSVEFIFFTNSNLTLEEAGRRGYVSVTEI
jgi:hypothetical protein